MTGYKEEEVLLNNCRFLQGFDTDEKEINKIRKAIKKLKSNSVLLKNYRKDGSYFWNQFIISPIFDNKKAIYFIGLQFDVTKQVEEKTSSQQKIQSLSNFDQLTGLMKLDYFMDTLQKMMNQPSKITIIRINLNRFRNINNSYGEHVSDGVLVEVANRLKLVFKKNPISRSFADDFIVLHSPKDTMELENALLAVELELIKPYTLLGEEVSVDFSIGISQYPQDGIDVEQLLSYAALAVRQAKLDSHSTHYFFNGALAEKLDRRMTIERNFAKGLQNNEFAIHYQAKVAADSSGIVGMEALVRWHDSEKGLISPGEFIPIAEETGFIIELGAWVLLEACKANKKWHDRGLLKVPVSVNVSAVQFVHPNFTKMVQDVLKQTGLPVRYLELEITESLLINPSMVLEKLRELKQIGVTISIDDFGSGYSSINYLKELPIDTLKIDRAFVTEIPHSPKDNALLLSIIQLGKSLGLSVLAEGVEVEEQVSFLSKSGCDTIQGFYFSRPLDEGAMEEKLKQ